MSKSDYYEILGCSKTASESELKKLLDLKQKNSILIETQVIQLLPKNLKRLTKLMIF